MLYMAYNGFVGQSFLIGMFLLFADDKNNLISVFYCYSLLNHNIWSHDNI